MNDYTGQPHICALCDEYPCTCHSPLELVCPYCGCEDLDVSDEPRGLFKCMQCGGEFV